MTSTQKSYTIWGVFILGVIAMLWGLAHIGGNGTGGTGTTTGSTLSEPVTTEDNIKGNPEASVTLVEYSDFQCPACASAYPVVKRLADEFGDKIAIAYRHYPLRQIHPNAQLAAQAAEAAANQGKFWEMHDELFDNQRSWGNSETPIEFFYTYAETLELDMDQFRADLTSDETKDKVNADYSSGSRSNVPGTPTFYLNGEQLSSLGSYGSISNMIREALGETPTETESNDSTTTTTQPKVKSAN